jgi:hypothetical protein
MHAGFVDGQRGTPGGLPAGADAVAPLRLVVVVAIGEGHVRLVVTVRVVLILVRAVEAVLRLAHDFAVGVLACHYFSLSIAARIGSA